MPESLTILEDLGRYETRAMHGQMPIVWDRAKDFQVWDRWGNCWLDFTSTIFVANAGHANQHITDAVKAALDADLVHSYSYATEIRASYLKRLVAAAPEGVGKAYLMSTGTEATEAAMRVMRIHGAKTGKGPGIISFDGSYHGRTLGAALMSGTEDSRRWIGHDDPNHHRFAFPFQRPCGDNTDWAGAFQAELAALRDRGIDPARDISGFLLETYIGWAAAFFPVDYVRALSDFAQQHGLVVAFDEVQSGFGRTGRLFGFEHYGVEPDLICCGKGIGNGLPLSSLLGSAELLDLPETGLLSSTHSANPLVCAAGLATLEELERRNLVAESARKGQRLLARLNRLQGRHPDRIAQVNGKGLVAAIILADPANGEPDGATASRICEAAMRKGVLFVHTGRESIKFGPPLTITDAALEEGLDVLDEIVDGLDGGAAA
ncbi:MAG: aspartate aminotransferase family protein [Alphaproteobacteria bacterium]|nr:aspartate aminotransferase family protein [Alphaproteobacteria bacterium]MDP6563693.1 aspartate aminotransferase family protein [Alphaproteobacteria bacterium]MDP6814547.1 aspartate aminotransferase family protein [Alphaproteobacteria bacterium]